MANIYFLIICILSIFPQVSPFPPANAFPPFIFVVMVSVVREGVEDLFRYKSDRDTNNTKVRIISEDGFTKEIKSKDVQVGDLLFIPEETMFPADLILVSSSLEGGIAFIQTSSLDGEKNLKKRQIPKDFNYGEQTSKPIKQKKEDPNKSNPKGILEEKNLESIEQTKFQIPTFQGTCNFDPPDKELYKFNGKMNVQDVEYTISQNQLLLKGSILKNTQCIIGFVVYTGKHTRLMMNSQKSRFKLSKVEYKMNKLVISILGIQFTLCLIISLIDIRFYSSHRYLLYEWANVKDSVGSNFIQTIFRYFLLLNTLIPISLIVTIEMVKLMQAYFISSDAQMYCQYRDRPAKVSSASLNEELGQVDYIFSDKTGTLTQNIMQFKLCHVGYELYGNSKLLEPSVDISKIEQEVLRNNPKQGTQYVFKNNEIDQMVFDPNYQNNQTHYEYKIFSKNRELSINFKTQRELVYEFLKLLSTAHDCMPEKKVADGQEQIFYQGPSPDEVTLCEFAQQHGFEYFFGTESSAKVREQVPNERGNKGQVISWKLKRVIEFQVIRRIEFTSARKRMSIIMRDPDDGHYKLYCKGADSEILKRIDQSQIDPQMMKDVKKFLDQASNKGFRTLLQGMRLLTQKEVEEFESQCKIAQADLKTKDGELEKLFDKFETDLVIVGATCVEDKLQDNVPETIQQLQTAGIKIWVCTGDKLETAENIGHSCKLLNNNGMEIIKCRNREDILNEFNEKKALQNEEKMKKLIQRGLIIEADALKEIIDDKSYEIKRYFLKIAKSCEAVICCRVGPAQKASVVRMIKEDDPETITLSIGDGANDVPMILEAHIGVGLYGNEGMNAVQNSDYALGQFQFLWRLLLLHGRWSYIRNADLILYFFYKNLVFTLPEFFFGFINTYSGTAIYDSYYISFYNLFFTSLPLMVKAIFDQDLNPDLDGEEIKPFMPKVYYLGQRSLIFNYKQFGYWFITGIMHGLIVFLLPFGIYQENLLNVSAENNDMWSFSVSSFTAVIVIVNLKLMVSERYFTAINFVCIFLLSFGIYFCYIWGSNYTGFSSTYQSMQTIFSTNQYYLSVGLCALLCYGFDIFIQSYIFELQPGPIEFLRRVIRTGQSLELNEEEFDNLYDEVRKQGVELSLARERQLDRKRERKMLLFKQQQQGPTQETIFNNINTTEQAPKKRNQQRDEDEEQKVKQENEGPNEKEIDSPENLNSASKLNRDYASNEKEKKSLLKQSNYNSKKSIQERDDQEESKHGKKENENSKKQFRIVDEENQLVQKRKVSKLDGSKSLNLDADNFEEEFEYGYLEAAHQISQKTPSEVKGSNYKTKTDLEQQEYV